MMWNSVEVALEEGVPTGQSSPCSSEKRVCTTHFGPLQRSAPALKDGRCPIRVSCVISLEKERKRKGVGCAVMGEVAVYKVSLLPLRSCALVGINPLLGLLGEMAWEW